MGTDKEGRCPTDCHPGGAGDGADEGYKNNSDGEFQMMNLPEGIECPELEKWTHPHYAYMDGYGHEMQNYNAIDEKEVIAALCALVREQHKEITNLFQRLNEFAGESSVDRLTYRKRAEQAEAQLESLGRDSIRRDNNHAVEVAGMRAERNEAVMQRDRLKAQLAKAEKKYLQAFNEGEDAISQVVGLEAQLAAVTAERDEWEWMLDEVARDICESYRDGTSSLTPIEVLDDLARRYRAQKVAEEGQEASCQSGPHP